ncbi:MAG: GGDEF domain-containing protein [Pseudomonadota bacterium]|nr:GGDEF domain-containing protein [Pseudomonadota bacterium]
MSTAYRDDTIMPSKLSNKSLKDKLQSEIRYLREKIAAQSVTIEHLKRQAMEDGLTGLANRRSFERSLEQSLSYFRRYKRGGAVLMIDVNSFKSINDGLGHLAGDAILKDIARILEQYTRESDVVARLGGDEFAIILQEVTPEQADEKAAQIASVIADTPTRYSGRDVYTSVSVGVCHFNAKSTSTDVLHIADSDMYDKKAEEKDSRL